MNGLIILVAYSSGQDFYYTEEVYKFDEDEEDDCESEEIAETSVAYLPVYFETEDADLAIIAVAYAACVSCQYVTFLSSSKTAKEWEESGYLGTLNTPEVKLPRTEEAFEISEPGDCFCCGSLKDYEVCTLAEMKESLEISHFGYILTELEDEKQLWQQFNEWSIRILNYPIFNENSIVNPDRTDNNIAFVVENDLNWLD